MTSLTHDDLDALWAASALGPASPDGACGAHWLIPAVGLALAAAVGAAVTLVIVRRP